MVKIFLIQEYDYNKEIFTVISLRDIVMSNIFVIRLAQ